ncbi:MAG: CPBP family intramembrane metalloprotease [Chloroflexi bacterium]|nr:CPBP family intramembrane metalloprotease [Chloroflexota bacterium]
MNTNLSDRTKMKDSKPFQEKFGELLRTNKLAILLEIAVVFVPLYILLVISNRLGGDDFLPLGGGLVLAGGPLVNLGLVLTIAIFWVVSRLRGSTWSDFGLARPKGWGRTILMGIGVTVGIIVSFPLLISLIQLVFPVAQQDLSRFDFLRGNLPNLILNVVAAWFTAGFLEELLWRGYLMNRLVDLQGKNTKLAWVIALVGSAIIFGLGHTYQGLGGVIRIIVAGLLFGAAFLTIRRNLWPLIFAHAVLDTISFVQHYFGG